MTDLDLSGSFSDEDLPQLRKELLALAKALGDSQDYVIRLIEAIAQGRSIPVTDPDADPAGRNALVAWTGWILETTSPSPLVRRLGGLLAVANGRHIATTVEAAELFEKWMHQPPAADVPPEEV